MLDSSEIRDAMHAPLDAVVPVACEVMADTETPVSAFLKLRRGSTAFLLESGEHDGRLGRYSFIGTAPDAVLHAELDRGTVTTKGDVRPYRGAPLAAVRELAGRAPLARGGSLAASLPRFGGGLVGAFGFDFARSLERLPVTLPDDCGFPAALFARYHTVLAFDHLRQRLLGISLLPVAATHTDRRGDLSKASARIEALVDGLRRPLPAADLRRPGASSDAVTVIPDDADFLDGARRAIEAIHAGEAIQVVLSRRIDTPFRGDALDLYRALRTISPSPYMFHLEFPDLALSGCSPEMLIRVENGAAQLSPIAGTRPRGAEVAEDASLEKELLADEKERAEHVMLTDLARNDLGRVCETGSVSVPRFMQVDRFSHVMHLVSVVTGRLRAGVDALDAFAAAFPAGTVSGAPKVRAMELIEELETVRRGSYAGAVAHIAPGAGALDSCITIRTAVVRQGRASVQVGAGIVADSIPERELAETRAKAAPLLRALGVTDIPAATPVPELAEAVA